MRVSWWTGTVPPSQVGIAAPWKTRATLGTGPDGSPFLQLMDREGKDRALLRYTEVTARGTGELIKRPGSSLLFFDQEDHVVWQAP